MSSLLVFFAMVPHFANAAPPQKARITRIVKDVNLVRARTSHAANVNAEIDKDTAVRTGAESRAELAFLDQSLARLGANSIFTFNEGAREIDVSSGALLLYVPKNTGGAKISTAAVTAAITGTTVMVESRRDQYVKLILLEGKLRASLNRDRRQSVVMHPGQMLIVRINARTLPKPVEIDLRLLRQTSGLLHPALPSDGLIRAEEQKQLAESPAGGLVDPTAHETVDQAIGGAPSTPRKGKSSHPGQP